MKNWCKKYRVIENRKIIFKMMRLSKENINNFIYHYDKPTYLMDKLYIYIYIFF